MNICIFAANYLPNVGGIERYTYYLSKELIKMGNTVTVVTNNVVLAENEEVSPEGIKIKRFPCFNFLGGRYPVKKNTPVTKKIYNDLLKEDFDFIIINARFYFHSILGARLAKKKNIPCLTIEHGSTHLSVNNKFFDFLGGIWEHFITAILKCYCSDYYGVSQAAGQWSKHFNIKSKGVLYNAVDLDEIDEIINNPVCSYKKEYNVPENATTVCFTGRLIPEKGIVQLIEAFKKINRQDVYLFIAGDGPLFEALNKKEDRIIFLGRLDFKQVISLLKETDIFCLPSVSEGLSTSCMEAVATKNFVITTETGGTKELIAGDEFGKITKGNSVEETYDALLEAINDVENRNSAVNNAYQRLKEGFTWEKTAQKVANIIKKGK